MVRNIRLEQNSDNIKILYYKNQGDKCLNDFDFGCFAEEDLVLILTTQYQIDMYTKHGQDVICIDGTHGTNSRNFHLTMVLVLDDMRMGFPVFAMYSSRCDTFVYRVLFSTIQDLDTNVKTHYFMSDDYPAYYNAFKLVFKHDSRKLLCAWHTSKSLKSRFQCLPEDKRSLIAPLFGKIFSLEKGTFWSAYAALHTPSYKSDPSILKFVEYLDRTWFRNILEAKTLKETENGLKEYNRRLIAIENDAVSTRNI